MHLPKPMYVAKAARALRVAISYSRNPLPMVRADQMTVAHLISFLHARGHLVDAYVIDDGGDPSPEESTWLKEHCNAVYSYPLSKPAKIWAALSAVPRWKPFQIALYDHPDQRRDLAARADQYDVVYSYYIRSAQSVRKLGRKARDAQDGPVSFVAYQLSQELNTRRIAENAPHAGYAAFYSLERRLLEAYEARVWQDFDRAVLIGTADVAAVQASCTRQGQPALDNYVFGAHGTNLGRFAPRTDIEQVPGRLIFSGVMRTPTNVQAAQWFAKNCWPKIKAAVPEASWHIVGRDPSPVAKALGQLEGVTVTGTVPDPAENIAEAEICINPMQAGGGMQNKLIEFLASGRATVATPVANEGIMGVPDRDLMIAEGADDFADAVIALLKDPNRRAALAAAGRRYVQDNWTWEAHWMKLEQDFYDALDGKAPGRVQSPAEALAAAGVDTATEILPDPGWSREGEQ